MHAHRWSTGADPRAGWCWGRGTDRPSCSVARRVCRVNSHCETSHSAFRWRDWWSCPRVGAQGRRSGGAACRGVRDRGMQLVTAALGLQGSRLNDRLSAADSTMVMLQGAIGQARPAGFRQAAGNSSTMPALLRCVRARVSMQHLFGAFLLSVTAGQCRSGASLPTARRCNIRTWPVRGAPLGVTRKPFRRGRRTAYSPPGRASAYLCFLALVARGTAVGAASRWARAESMTCRRVLISALIGGGARAHRSKSMRLPTSALLWRVVCHLVVRFACFLTCFNYAFTAFPATRCPLLRCSTVLCSRRRADLSPTKTVAQKTRATNATGGEIRSGCAVSLRRVVPIAAAGLGLAGAVCVV